MWPRTMLMVIAAGLGVPASPQAAPSTAAKPLFETCASLSSLYASAGKPEYEAYSVTSQPILAVAGIKAHRGSPLYVTPAALPAELVQQTSNQLFGTLRLWADKTARPEMQERVHVIYDNVVGVMGTPNFIQVLRHANDRVTALGGHHGARRDLLNSNLRINMHSFGAHAAEVFPDKYGALAARTTPADLVRVFTRDPDLLQGVHGSTWSFTIRSLLDLARTGSPIWVAVAPSKLATAPVEGSGSTPRSSGKEIVLSREARELVAEKARSICGSLNSSILAFNCIHGMGHAGSYVALNVLKNRLEREELEELEESRAIHRAEQLPEAMTRGATVCVAASAGIAELDEYSESRRAFEFGCGAGVWMVTWQHQARVDSALHTAMLEWKNTTISADTATVVASDDSSISDELTAVADRIGPCAGEPNINYPQWCFSWWLTASTAESKYQTPSTLGAADCVAVAVAATPDHGAACAFAMASRYMGDAWIGEDRSSGCGWDDTRCKTPPHTRCDGYRGGAAHGVRSVDTGVRSVDTGVQRRMYLACLAGSTMANAERMIASLREPKVEAYAASCAAEIAAGDGEAFGACMSPIAALIGGPDCLPDILGIAR